MRHMIRNAILIAPFFWSNQAASQSVYVHPPRVPTPEFKLYSQAMSNLSFLTGTWRGTRRTYNRAKAVTSMNETHRTVSYKNFMDFVQIDSHGDPQVSEGMKASGSAVNLDKSTLLSFDAVQGRYEIIPLWYNNPLGTAQGGINLAPVNLTDLRRSQPPQVPAGVTLPLSDILDIDIPFEAATLRWAIDDLQIIDGQSYKGVFTVKVDGDDWVETFEWHFPGESYVAARTILKRTAKPLDRRP